MKVFDTLTTVKAKMKAYFALCMYVFFSLAFYVSGYCDKIIILSQEPETV
jgi:hypothetical protein